MGNIINGLEIANKRIKEKEELTGPIFFWSAAVFYYELGLLARRRASRKKAKKAKK